jgi:protein gp37
MSKSTIEWTEETWNPVTGCTKVSAGCKYCYAEIMAKRLQAMGVAKYADAFKVRMHPDSLKIPHTWRTPRTVFVNSMGDLFHEQVPLSFIQEVFAVMNDMPQHTYQVLTKRSKRLLEIHEQLNWTPNIWMGVSVEDSRVIDRVDDLRQVNALTKFLSCEPLIGAIPNINLDDIDWVIVGGESGRKPRPMSETWVKEIRDRCIEYDVAFFFKQWGGTNKKKTGRLLDGVTYDDFPVSKRISSVNSFRQ